MDMWQEIKNAPWNELYIFLSSGNPPLIFQLLALNTIVFIYFVLRRMRGAHALRSETASVVQSLLLAANIVIIFGDDLKSIYLRVLH